MGSGGTCWRRCWPCPEQYRAPVHLFYYEDLAVEQIAKILGLREGTVRTRLSRARGMLRDMLKEDEEHA